MLVGEAWCDSGNTYTSAGFATWPDFPMFQLTVNFLKHSTWKRSWTITCVASTTEFNSDSTMHMFVGMDHVDDTIITSSSRSRVPLQQNKLLQVSKAMTTTNKTVFFGIIDVFALIFLVVLFVIAGLYLFGIEKKSKAAKKGGEKSIIAFWNLTCSMLRLNILQIYTNGGRLIVAGLIFCFFNVDGVFIGGTAVANDYTSKIGLYATVASLKNKGITAPAQYVSFLQTIYEDDTIKAQTETSAVRIIDNIIDGREQATVITIDMLQASGLTYSTGEDQLRDIYQIDDVYTQLEYPAYFRTTLMTDAADIKLAESALLQLQISGKGQAMVKSAGYDYLIKGTRSFYAETTITLWQSEGIVMFQVICQLILFVVLGIQVIQRKGDVVKYKKVQQGETDEAKTFNKDMSILLKFDKILTINTNKFNQRQKDLSSIVISFGKLAENYKHEMETIFSKDQVLKSLGGDQMGQLNLLSPKKA